MGKYADRLPFGSGDWKVVVSDAGRCLICARAPHLAAGQLVLAEVRPLDLLPGDSEPTRPAEQVAAVMACGPSLVRVCERLLEELRFGHSSYADRCRLVEETTTILDRATCGTPA